MGKIVEGSVIIVLGKMDERVRAASGGIVMGTVWCIDREEVAVLLPDNNIWKGKLREVALESENKVDGVTNVSES